ncbi:hypothetical protein HYX00_00590, partial [Candidatus Woesearchaeota archaeon]|nr:hypothetical protein [Candidatus Woesearchaeota archaeon]
SYTTNFQKQEKGELDVMLTDAKAISSSLALSGYPNDWDNTTVIRIGIADEQKVNATKVKTFDKLDYPTTKKRFGTIFDYFVFFVNDKGEVLNINGICGVGYWLINTSYNIKSAYYYQDDDDDFLKNFMSQTFKADIYFKDQTNDIYGLYGLISNLSKYSFVMMEHPLLSGGDFSDYKPKFENFSSRGGLLMISGELASPSTNNMVGVDFKKRSGQSESERVAIVNNTDPLLSLTIGQSMVFAQYYYVKNTSAIDFKIIATFNQTDDKAIAKWEYGNGTVYFFSDFDVSNFNGNFVDLVQEAAKSFVESTCNPINITGINLKKLVKTERYLNYNSKVVKMIVYVWR